MLYTPEPYPTEPANNWSQVIITDAASKELHLRGFIRTEEATEAALWLQCFSRNPARVVAAQTSSLELPVRGTTGWTEVRLAITAPQQTDFLVVRCVLTGTGKAWFDAIELRVGDHSISPLEGLEPSEETVGADSQEDLVREVLALGESIQQSMRELEAANASLLEQIASLRRTSVIDRRPAPLVPSIVSPPLLEPLATGPVRHPLVPHGYLEGIMD